MDREHTKVYIVGCIKINMTSHEDRRKERMNIIRSSIKAAEEAGESISKEKLIKTCCMEWGSTRRTILEYFKTMGLNLN